MSKPKVAIVRTGGFKGNPEFLGGKFVRYDEDIKQVKDKLRETINLAVGGIDNIVKAGETVLIKPNLAFLAPPELHSRQARSQSVKLVQQFGRRPRTR